MNVIYNFPHFDDMNDYFLDFGLDERIHDDTI